MPNQVAYRHDTWVQIQRLKKQAYEFDPTPTDWIDVFKPLRVSLQPVGNPEVMFENKAEGRWSHIVRMPWKPGIESSWRLKVLKRDAATPYQDGDRILHIDKVEDWNDKKRYLKLYCMEQPLASLIGVEENGWDWQGVDIVHEWQDGSDAIWSDG